MSLVLTLVASLSATTASPAFASPAISVAANNMVQKPASKRSKARVSIAVSATIIRMEKVSPLTEAVKPGTEAERPVAKQRIIKSGVPYVEFY